jgi:hypothetical protein
VATAISTRSFTITHAPVVSLVDQVAREVSNVLRGLCS